MLTAEFYCKRSRALDAGRWSPTKVMQRHAQTVFDNIAEIPKR